MVQNVASLGITMFVNLVDEIELRRLDPYYSSYLPRVNSILTEEPQLNPKITANTIKYLHFPIKGKIDFCFHLDLDQIYVLFR
jgi:hypothetical protein